MTAWAPDPLIPNFTQQLHAKAMDAARVLHDMPEPKEIQFQIRLTNGFWRDATAQEAVEAYGRGIEIRDVTVWKQPVPEDRDCPNVDPRYGRCRRTIHGRRAEHEGLHRNNGAVWS